MSTGCRRGPGLQIEARTWPPALQEQGQIIHVHGAIAIDVSDAHRPGTSPIHDQHDQIVNVHDPVVGEIGGAEVALTGLEDV